MRLGRSYPGSGSSSPSFFSRGLDRVYAAFTGEQRLGILVDEAEAIRLETVALDPR